MKSHLSCMSLTPNCRAFQKPLWLREGRERPPDPDACLFPSPSLILSVTHVHCPSPYILSQTHPLTFSFSLTHTFPHRCTDNSVPSLSLSAHPASTLPVPQTYSTHPCPFSSTTTTTTTVSLCDSLPSLCVCFFALSMKTLAH